MSAHRLGFRLTCPHDHAPLAEDAAGLHCGECGALYPVVAGVPVLIDDSASVFAVADYARARGYAGPSYGRDADGATGARRLYHRLARWLGDAPSSLRHPDPAEVLAWMASRGEPPRVLVVGSGGTSLGGPGDRVLQTDVAFGPGVHVIADAHDLPFEDAAFDLVVAVAVLEHVADPQRCVAQIHRVLAPGGHVYAVTPFLQPVHMGAHDFTRFTPIGHRRLFRHFDEVAAGVALGMGSVLGFTFSAALLSMSRARAWRLPARFLGLLATPLLRRLDGVLRHGADAAGGCWFLGERRAGAPIADRSLVASYHADFPRRPARLPPSPPRSPSPAAPPPPAAPEPAASTSRCPSLAEAANARPTGSDS